MKQQTAIRLAKQQENRQRKNTRNNQKAKASRASRTLTPSTVTADAPAYVPKLVVHASSNTDPSNLSVQSSDASVSNYSGYATHASYNSKSVPHGQGLGYNVRMNRLIIAIISIFISDDVSFNNFSFVKRCERAQCLPSSSYNPVRVQKNPKLRQNLVHGLTVQELKEMTRARLANEATEENGSVTTTPVTDDTSHYSFHRAMSYDEGVRQRFYSADSWRPPSKVPSRSWNPFVKSQNNSHLLGHHHPGISSFYSADAADSMSVNSFVSGYGTESHMDSETADIYATASSVDMGRSMSFPAGNDVTDAYYDEQQRQLKIAASFEAERPQLNGIGVPSSILSNLVEGKHFPPGIAPNLCLGSDRQGYDFAGLPATPAVQRSPFCDDALTDLLHQQPVTPSTMQTLGLSEEYQTPDAAQLRVPDLDHSSLDKVSIKVSLRSSDLPNSVAESVLGYSEDHLEARMIDNPTSTLEGTAGEHISNPWIENEENVLSKIEKDLNNLLLFENNGRCKNDNFATSPLDNGWNPGTSSNLSPNRPFVNAVPENFNDDDVESVFTPERRRLGESSYRNSPSKSSSKRRNTSRWNFLNL